LAHRPTLAHHKSASCHDSLPRLVTPLLFPSTRFLSSLSALTERIALLGCTLSSVAYRSCLSSRLCESCVPRPAAAELQRLDHQTSLNVLQCCVPEIDTKVKNDGGRSNSSGPHAKRNLWDLELPTTRREPKDLCLGWIKLKPIGAHPQTNLGNKKLCLRSLVHHVWGVYSLSARKQSSSSFTTPFPPFFIPPPFSFPALSFPTLFPRPNQARRSGERHELRSGRKRIFSRFGFS